MATGGARKVVIGVSLLGEPGFEALGVEEMEAEEFTEFAFLICGFEADGAWRGAVLR